MTEDRASGKRMTFNTRNREAIDMTEQTKVRAQLSMEELEGVNGGIWPVVAAAAFAGGFYLGYEIGQALK